MHRNSDLVQKKISERLHGKDRREQRRKLSSLKIILGFLQVHEQVIKILCQEDESSKWKAREHSQIIVDKIWVAHISSFKIAEIYVLKLSIYGFFNNSDGLQRVVGMAWREFAEMW